MALSFEQATPLALFEVIHTACEETPIYRGKTSLQSILRKLIDWDVYAIRKNGELIGSVMFLGNEGHIAVLDKHRKAWCGKEFYRFMREQVEKRGVIQAICGNPDALRFIERLEKRGYVCLAGKNY